VLREGRQDICIQDIAARGSIDARGVITIDVGLSEAQLGWTVVHEFAHAVQRAYRSHNAQPLWDGWSIEGHAEWMARRTLHPENVGRLGTELLSRHRLVPGPDRSDPGQAAATYGAETWFDWLEMEHGETLPRRLFEASGDVVDTRALDEVLRGDGSSLAERWVEFATWAPELWATDLPGGQAYGSTTPSGILDWDHPRGEITLGPVHFAAIRLPVPAPGPTTTVRVTGPKDVPGAVGLVGASLGDERSVQRTVDATLDRGVAEVTLDHSRLSGDLDRLTLIVVNASVATNDWGQYLHHGQPYCYEVLGDADGEGGDADPYCQQDEDEEAATACGAAPPGGFTDAAGNVHATAIDCIVWYGITQGVGPGLYSPSATVRRDQMASFLARELAAAGVELADPVDQGFVDLGGNVHAEAINQLAAVGVARGTSATTFSPGSPVRRDQLATFVDRAHEQVTGARLPAGDARFVDVQGNLHEASIEALAAAGIVHGVAPDRYGPELPVRRDQMASFLARHLDLLHGTGRVTPPG
jgi:hypothetical protein